ncbi:hypothetical protein niasHT_035404 [Heterodera trifolii]|uniref:Secreted protein n=1 Tax=Heterodera trifolii TaxID=157864 RepID=A0ABD2IIM6_9BILA
MVSSFPIKIRYFLFVSAFALSPITIGFLNLPPPLPPPFPLPNERFSHLLVRQICVKRYQSNNCVVVMALFFGFSTCCHFVLPNICVRPSGYVHVNWPPNERREGLAFLPPHLLAHSVCRLSHAGGGN